VTIEFRQFSNGVDAGIVWALETQYGERALFVRVWALPDERSRDSWLPAKLSPRGTEVFRGFGEPVGFHHLARATKRRCTVCVERTPSIQQAA
jgi:hypothetical protein